MVSLPNLVTNNACLTVILAAGESPPANYTEYHEEDGDVIATNN